MTAPGFTEIDLVAHCGDRADGEFVHSLNLTDIHTTWVETRAVLSKGEVGVQQALETLRQALPFRLQGIDSDNGSEFINDHLYRYCRQQAIQFTRGRPYKKDDNAHIEQKNWTHVRKLLGYVRYDTPAALAAINALYATELRLLQNLFLPSVKLVGKERVGARLRRRYDAARTPFERVCESPQAIPAAVAHLTALRARLDPFALAQAIERKLERIYALARHPVRSLPPAPRTASPAAGPRPSADDRRRAHGPDCGLYSSARPPSPARPTRPFPGYFLNGAMISAPVTFLNGLTGSAPRAARGRTRAPRGRDGTDVGGEARCARRLPGRGHANTERKSRS